MFDRKGEDVKNVEMMKLGLRADRYTLQTLTKLELWVI